MLNAGVAMLLQTSFEFAFPAKTGVCFLHTPEHWRLAFRDLDIRILDSQKPTVLSGYSTVRFKFHSVLGVGHASLFSNNATSASLVVDDTTCIHAKVHPFSNDHHILTFVSHAPPPSIMTQVLTAMCMKRHTIKHALRRHASNVLLEDENFRLYRKQIFG